MEKSTILSALAGAAAIIVTALANVGTYFHESAHKKMAHVFYKITNEKLLMTPFLHAFLQGKNYGVYEYTSNEMTLIGQYLGERISNALVAIAGPTVDTLIAFSLYAIGYVFHRTQPNLSIAFQTAGLVYFLSSLNHVKGAFFSHNGDLYNFSVQIGISPFIVGLIFALSLPLLIIILYIFLQKG